MATTLKKQLLLAKITLRVFLMIFESVALFVSIASISVPFWKPIGIKAVSYIPLNPSSCQVPSIHFVNLCLQLFCILKTVGLTGLLRALRLIEIALHSKTVEPVAQVVRSPFMPGFATKVYVEHLYITILMMQKVLKLNRHAKPLSPSSCQTG